MNRSISFIALAAFAVSGVLIVGTYAATSAQTVAISADQASDRWVCRRAEDPATYDATMKDAHQTQLVCKPLRIEAHYSDNSMARIGNTRTKAAQAPDLSHALTAMQVNDAWVHFVMKQLNEMPFTGGA